MRGYLAYLAARKSIVVNFMVKAGGSMCGNDYSVCLSEMF